MLRVILLIIYLGSVLGSPSHLGIAVLIVPSGSFFHAQTNVSVDITEELSPNVRMIHFPLDIYNVQAVSIPNGLHRPFRRQQDPESLDQIIAFQSKRGPQGHSNLT